MVTFADHLDLLWFLMASRCTKETVMHGLFSTRVVYRYVQLYSHN